MQEVYKVKRKYISDKKKKEIFARDGNRCINCGCTDASKFIVHHIIPLESGGHDVDSNLTTLCESCHVRFHKAHDGIFIGWKNGGRKVHPMPENYQEIALSYVYGQIGNKEAKQKLKMSQKSHLIDTKWFRELLEEHDIERYENFIDKFAYMKIALKPGLNTGYTEFKNGNHVDNFYGVPR